MLGAEAAFKASFLERSWPFAGKEEIYIGDARTAKSFSDYRGFLFSR